MYYSKEVILPDQLLKLGTGTFARCLSLEKAVFSSALLVIPDGLFAYDLVLQEVTIPQNSRLKAVRPGAFLNCNALASLILPDGVQKIHRKAFYRYKKLATFHFPKNLKYIGDHVFYFCRVSELSFPDSLEYIGEGAFFKCKLESLLYQALLLHQSSYS